MIGLLGRKIGMTQCFDENGAICSITLVSAGPCTVIAKRKNKLLLGFEDVPAERLKKPQAGFFKKVNIAPKKVIKEFFVDEKSEYTPGQELTVEIFQPGDYLDVSGLSKGKGFQGGMRRWNWSGGPESHGSMSHRRPGSIGQNTSPGRVLRGHHMPGHMGNAMNTVQSVKLIKIDSAKNLLAIRGAVPGGKNSLLMIKASLKRRRKVAPAAPAAPKKADK
jgi:large subunit ribosomal protein L3